MILPNLPSKFSSGETLTAAKLNAMIDWMRDVARLLPGLQVNTGRGLVYSRSSAGTTVSLAHGYIQGSDSGDETAEAPAAQPRRLFAWSAETGGDEEKPTWTVSVTDGLAIVRPNQACAPEMRVAGVILGVGAGTVEVGVAKTELSFAPETIASEFSLVATAKLEDDESTETGSVTELISVNVPGYKLTSNGTASVVTGISTGESSRTVSFTVPANQSTSEFAIGATFTPATLELSADPVGKAHWDHVLVVHEPDHNLTSTVTLNTSKVSMPQQTGTATVSVPTASVSGTATVPTSYTLTPTGTASSTEVSVTIPIAGAQKLTTEITKIGGWLTGGSVRSKKLDETELMTLDFSDAKIGTAKLAGDDELSEIAPTSRDVQISREESTLHWVKGASFDLTPADAGTLISLVAVMNGGQLVFSWEKRKLPANDGNTEIVSGDDPQELKLRVEAAVIARENSETLFGVVSGLEGAWDFGANWRVCVPMAVVFKSDEGNGAYVEPLTWGCVEIKPRLRVTLNGGGEASETANATPASLSDAQVDALATAATSAYDLEAKDFI